MPDGMTIFEGVNSDKMERVQWEKDTYLMRFFDSEDFWRCGNISENHNPSRDSSRKSDSGSWSGCKTWEEAYDLGINGWLEGVEKMEAVLEGVKIAQGAISGESRKRLRGVHGSKVDVPRAMSGSPRCMVRRKNVRTKDGTHIKVAANVTASAFEDADTIMRRGVAIAALVSRLESDGYGVELMAYSSTRRDGHSFIVEIPVKRPEDYLNKERIAMLLGHPATLRRGVFAVQERTPKGFFEMAVRDGYGSVSSLTDEARKQLGITLDLKALHDDDKDYKINWEKASDKDMAEWIEAKWKRALEGALNNE